MTLSRRDFVKLCTGTVAGIGVSRMFHPAINEALAESLTGDRPPVLWIQGQGCTGCSVSLLNSTNPNIADILLKVISLDFHPTVMGGEGEGAYKHMLNIVEKFSGQYFVVVEGAIPTAHDGKFCIIAENGHDEISMVTAMHEIAAKAAAVLAVGTCSAYGGIPAANGNQTESRSVRDFFAEQGIATPVVNIPGCPPHPDWIIGTIGLALAAIKDKGLADGLADVVALLDSEGRPEVFYGTSVHDLCPYLPAFEDGTMAEIITDQTACRYDLGCKGPQSMCDSATRGWNGNVNWCIQNAVCIGCVEPDFPDGQSPFYSS